MRVLFIHRDFPASFRAEAQYFGLLPETTVLFLSERCGRDARLSGVRRLRIAPSQAPAAGADEDISGRTAALFLRRAAQTAKALQRLRDSGFVPDLLFCPAEGGYGLYARDIFPESLLIVRADWFDRPGESFRFFTHGAARPAADFAPARTRNMFRLNSLMDADLMFTGSQWQKSQFPEVLQQELAIMPDGVDCRFFSPAPASFPEVPPEGEIVSFCCKGDDPARGLMTFVQALPSLLQRRKKCHVLIMDSRPAGEKGGATERKTGLSSLLEQHIPAAYRDRVLTPAYSLSAYRQMLRASALHVYLTAPQSLSAGLFEAMSCGTLTLGSDTPPVREVLQHGINGFLCDFWDHKEMADSISRLLELAPRFQSLRQAARERVLQHYDRTVQTLRRVEWIRKEAEKRRNQTRPQSEVSPASFSRA